MDDRTRRRTRPPIRFQADTPRTLWRAECIDSKMKPRRAKVPRALEEVPLC